MATATELLAAAQAELGVKEAPAGSNRVKYNEWYYGRAVSGASYPWCMAFVQWCFARVGAADLLPVRTASCGALMRFAQAVGLWVTKGFRPGDVVIYDFDGNGSTDHTGIVERVTASGVTAIEGNTGTGNDANGGQVMRRERTNRQILGAVRPRFEEEANVVTYKYLRDIPTAFRPTIQALMDAGIIRGDGSDPHGNGDVIDLSREQVRTLVFCYRGGAFDARFREAGMKPAVG